MANKKYGINGHKSILIANYRPRRGKWIFSPMQEPVRYVVNLGRVHNVHSVEKEGFAGKKIVRVVRRWWKEQKSPWGPCGVVLANVSPLQLVLGENGLSISCSLLNSEQILLCAKFW